MHEFSYFNLIFILIYYLLINLYTLFIKFFTLYME